LKSGLIRKEKMLKKILKVLGISQETDDTKSSERQNIGQNKSLERDLELEGLLIEVAREFEDENRFNEVAKNVASKLEFSRAKSLTRYFHNNPPEPDTLKSKTSKYGILGVWMDICQNSIFEILFNYKEQAIPTLYSIGFGKYDWTQYKAIDVLCRLANEGIQTTEIIKDIGDEIQSFRYEAVFPSLESLSTIPNNEEVPKIILRVFDEYSKDDPIDGLDILRILAINYPDKVKSKLSFIKEIAKGQGIENRSPLLDGAILAIDEEGNESYSIGGEEIQENFEEVHRINAAVLYYHIDSEDKEINQLIDFWEKNAEDEDH